MEYMFLSINGNNILPFYAKYILVVVMLMLF